jgi:hypothetical protein
VSGSRRLKTAKFTWSAFDLSKVGFFGLSSTIANVFRNFKYYCCFRKSMSQAAVHFCSRAFLRSRVYLSDQYIDRPQALLLEQNAEPKNNVLVIPNKKLKARYAGGAAPGGTGARPAMFQAWKPPERERGSHL